jgi:hypothetical protein
VQVLPHVPGGVELASRAAPAPRAAPPVEAVWVPERGGRVRVRDGVGEAVRRPHRTPAGTARGEQLGGARHGQGRWEGGREGWMR